MTDFANQLFGGSWTEEKLEILKNYLDAYNTALKDKPFRRVYIDAFAGTGYRQNPSTRYKGYDIFEEFTHDEPKEFLKGSAALSLEATPAFDQYYFIESDLNKVAELEKLRERIPDKVQKVEIIQSDANIFIREYCVKTDWRNTRAVLFLDPFATEVQWETIEAIARTQCIDVWILFPLMAINRLLAKDHTKAFYDCLNRFFGTEDWFERFYKTRVLEDIFGQSVESVYKACDFNGIGEFYKERLKSIFSGVSEKPKIFYNRRDTPLFQFFFAAGNPRGATIAVRIADHLLRKI